MNPRTTALVLIEYQNDFTTPRGKLHEAVKAVMESTNMLENTVEMVDEARKAGATIPHRAVKDGDRSRDLERRHKGVAQAAPRLDHVTVIRPEVASQPVEEPLEPRELLELLELQEPLELLQRPQQLELRQL